MPKSVPQAELDKILDAVSTTSDSISIERIIHAFDNTIPRRTLQRRLALLVAQGKLVADGRGRGCRYRLPVDITGKRPSHDQPLNRDTALAILGRLKPELKKRFGVTRLALFGSTVRNRARPDSDVDIVVAFDGPATSQRYFGVQFLLEDELGHTVDLITEKAMRPELKPYIEREAVDA